MVIYYGSRGCGKTTNLVADANRMYLSGSKVLFLTTLSTEDNLRGHGLNPNIPIVNYSYFETHRNDYKDYKIYIDNIEYFMKFLLRVGTIGGISIGEEYMSHLSRDNYKYKTLEDVKGENNMFDENCEAKFQSLEDRVNELKKNFNDTEQALSGLKDCVNHINQLGIEDEKAIFELEKRMSDLENMFHPVDVVENTDGQYVIQQPISQQEELIGLKRTVENKDVIINAAQTEINNLREEKEKLEKEVRKYKNELSYERLMKTIFKPREVKHITFNEKAGCTTIVDDCYDTYVAQVRGTDEYDKYVGYALAEMYMKYGSKTKFHKYVDEKFNQPKYNYCLKEDTRKAKKEAEKKASEKKATKKTKKESE